MGGVKGSRLVSADGRLHSHLPLTQCKDLPNFLRVSSSFFSRVFKDFPEDKCLNFEGAGSYLSVVVCNYPLLISNHLDRWD